MASTLSARNLFSFFGLLALVAGQHVFYHNAEKALFARAETLPACATSCLAGLAPQHGCSLTDADCLCNNADLTTATEACIGANCTIREVLHTQRITANTCDVPVRNRGRQCRVIMWSLFAISITFVALRLVARTKRFDGPGLGADDWTIIVVLVFMFPHEICLELMVQNGLGQDIWNVEPLDKLTTMSMVFWMGEMWYTFVVMGTKISILLLYLRIFPKTASSKSFRLTVWTLIGTCAACTAAFVLSTIFQCKPIAGAYKAWDGTFKATCFDNNAQIIAMAAVNITLDLTVFFLPLPKLVRLEISSRKKLGVCIFLLTGLFVTIVSIIRLIKFIQHTDSPNTTWSTVPISNWSQFEANVGIWCACMPALARLIKRFWVDVLGHKISNHFMHGEHTGRTNTASFIKSRVSHRSRVDSGSEVELRDDVEAPPPHGVAKTVEARVVFNRRVDSSDEVELTDKDSVGSESAMHHQHRYIRDW